MPDLSRMIFECVDHPALLAAGIVQAHRVLHPIREDKIINISPVAMEYLVSDLRISGGIPVRLGVRVVRTYVM